MGAYTRIVLKRAGFAEKVNNRLKELGLVYPMHNGVEWGLFRTEKMEEEDIRFVNEDPEGLKQNPTHPRPVGRDYFKNMGMKVGVWEVKISCPLEEEEKQIAVMQEFLKTDMAKLIVNFEQSEDVERLMNF